MMVRKTILFACILAWIPVLAFTQGTLSISGTVTAGADEQDIIDGGLEISLKLTGGATWDSAAVVNPTPWKSVFQSTGNWSVANSLTLADLEWNNDTVFKITFPALTTYLLTLNDTVTVTVPDGLLATGSSLNTPEFVISDLAPMVTLSGSLTSAAQEYSIRTGGLKLVYSLKYDTWYSNLDKNNAVTTAFLDGITGDQDWSTVSTLLGFANLNRDNSTQVTLTLPAAPNYAISVDENISVDIPATAFAGTSGAILSSAFVIHNQQATASATWSVTPLTEELVRAGGYKLTLDLTSADTWVVSTATLKTQFITGLSGNTEWNTKILPSISVLRVSSTKAEISFSSSSTFDINSPLNISFAIPDASLQISSGATLGVTPTGFTVTQAARSLTLAPASIAENNLNGGYIDLTLYDDVFADPPSLAPGDFSLSASPPNTSITSVSNRTSSGVRLNLAYTGDIDVNGNIQVTVLNGMSGGGTLVSGNNVIVTAVLEPVITGVAIPNKSFKINDDVPVTITVQDNSGTFTLTSGTVSNRPLTGLLKQNNTTYTASFKILSGEPDVPAASPVPVSVQMQVLGRPGNLYTTPITQDQDLLDANAPVISAFQALGTVHKIGDYVQLMAVADQAGYTIDSSQTGISGVSLSSPSFSFLSESGGSYFLSYQVSPGDPDVIAGSSPAGQISLKDFAGNSGTARPVTALSPSFRIDAHPPVISNVTAPDSFYISGETLTISITADGNGYTLSPETFINGISASSGRFSFSGAGPVYSLNYPIIQGDASAAKGNIPVNIVLIDPAGNKSAPYNSLLANAEVYTQRPTAAISGSNSICAGDSALLFVNLTGKPNWNIVVSDGSTSKNFNGIAGSTFSFKVAPTVNTTYSITGVSDNTGLNNTGFGLAVITINPQTNVKINPIGSAYNIESPAVPLAADKPGGVFSGPGVIGTENKFYPSIAGVLNSPHTILYTYINNFGCVSKDSLSVAVVEASGVIIIDDLYCYNSPPFIAQAVTDSVQIIGKFKLLRNDTLVSNGNGITDHGNNTATITPTILKPGNYLLHYDYFLKDSLSLEALFTVENVDRPEIIPALAATVCENEKSIELNGNARRGVFTWTGNNGVNSGGDLFDPGLNGPGIYSMTYTDSTVNGCKNSFKDTITVFYVPDMGFSISDSCILNTGTEVFFTNLTADKDSVMSWNWNFNDKFSAEPTSTAESPSHVYTKSGKTTVLLTETTLRGCVENYEITYDFGDKPTGKFDVENKCLADGVDTRFNSQFVSDDGISKYLWIITKPGGEVFKDSSNLSLRSFPLTVEGNYTVYHRVTASSNCAVDTTAVISLNPTQKVLPGVPFKMDFTTGNENWSISKIDDDINYPGLSWNWGSPDFIGLAGQGITSWYTKRADSGIPEISYLTSPCFDLNELERPMIKMDIFRNFITPADAAIIETSTDNGKNWSILGSPADGINWYGDFQTTNFAYGANYGWANLGGTDPDSGWVETRHVLDPVLGSSNVQFRLVYGAKSSSVPNYEGFAVRDVTIGERNRFSVMEYFANTTPLNPVKDRVIKASDKVDKLYNSALYKDFIKLEYHTQFPSVNDPLNQFNRDVPGARAFYYGINAVPYSIIDGGDRTGRRFDFSDAKFEPKALDIYLRSLVDPPVQVIVDASVTGNTLDGNVSLRALQDIPAGEKVLYIVLYETVISGSPAENGISIFRNVVRNMLPDAGGTGINQAFTVSPQTVVDIPFTADIGNLDKDRLRIAAYLQDDFTGEIYQAGLSDYSYYKGVGINPEQAFPNGLSVYPNPARDFVELKISGATGKSSGIEFMDQLGRKVLYEETGSFVNRMTIDISSLTRGIYFVRMTAGGVPQSRIVKLVITD